MLFYLCLGGNVGDTRHYLEKAVEQIGRRIGKVFRKSAIFESEPWGFSAERNFLNQVVVVSSELEPAEVLSTCLQIEAEQGRVRNGTGYQSRCIDIDIIFIDSLIIDTPRLKVPHPLMQDRKFVLMPLCGIAPDFVHPVFGKTVRQMLDECGDKSKCVPAG